MWVTVEINILYLVLFLLVLGHLCKGLCCVGFAALLREIAIILAHLRHRKRWNWLKGAFSFLLDGGVFFRI